MKHMRRKKGLEVENEKSNNMVVLGDLSKNKFTHRGRGASIFINSRYAPIKKSA